MALKSGETVDVSNLVPWPAARRHLSDLASSEYRLAAKAPTEFERGRHAGMAEMAEKLMNLPQALAILNEEDDRERKRVAHVQG